MKNCLIVLFILLSTSTGFTAEPLLSLKGKNGGIIKGSVEQGSVPKTVNVTRGNGKVYRNVPLASFSADSQILIIKELERARKQMGDAEITKDSRLAISFQRQKASNNNNYGDIDDRIIKIQPKVSIDSDEREKVYQKVTGEVIVIGKEVVRKDRWVILNRQKFTIARIEPDQRVTWEGREFECRYDPDYAGYDYEGYLIILRNKSGDVAMTKGSASRWEDVSESLLMARKGIGYDRSFSEKLGLYSTFGLPR